MKNKFTSILLTAFLLLNVTNLQAKDYYLATNGSDNNKGTSIDAPLATLAKAISMLQAGDICYVRGGTYYPASTVNITQTGTKDARICLFAYENENPVFDFKALPYNDNARGINHKIGANYWHYKGLTICNAGDNGMKLEGSFCVVERCTFYGNKDTGLQQGFGKGSKGENTRNPDFLYGRYNIVLNCDSYDNYDPGTSGGNADGFAIKLFPGPGNEFHGCRSWHNSDDGWDMYYTVFPVVIDNCWTMNNGFDKGNGNGFKVGGGKQGGDSFGAHVLTNCIALNNMSKGFDQNHHSEGSYMINCTSIGNGINYGFNMEVPQRGNWVLRNCVGFAPGTASGQESRNHRFTIMPDISNCSWMDIDNCNPLSDRDGGTNSSGIAYNKYDKGKWPNHSSEFISLIYDDAIAERQVDGQLPTSFGRLKTGSLFIDKGVNIENFQTIDSKKDAYKFGKDSYGVVLTIPFNGACADMGAFEYGIDNNDYTLVMPENDGSVPELTPNPSEWEENGKYYTEKVILDWYKFQNITLPDSINYITSNSINNWIKPNYVGKLSGGGDAPEDTPNSKYTGSKGAFYLPKTNYMDIPLTSLRNLQAKVYCTGGRDLKVTYTYNDGKTSSNTISYAEGTADLSLSPKSKTPVTVRLENVKASGDMYITDLYISGYQEVDEEGNPVTIGKAETFVYDMYQTETALIVYGEIASLQIVSMNGEAVAVSRSMQVVGTTNLPKGFYVVIITGKDGNKEVRKFRLK